ncbi:MAG: hypothetical protein ACK4ST_17300, partial [Elioraea tepidiphila]
EGTTFRLWFPAVAEAPATEAPAPAAPASAPRAARRVLLVEDEAPLRRLAQRALSAAGHEVVEAEDAEAALEAWAEDEAARELMALLSTLDATLGRALVAYLGLFRSGSRALSWERALRLAREALALDADPLRLGAALSQTVEQLRAKRDGGDIRPLSGHGYLKKVLAGTPAVA